MQNLPKHLKYEIAYIPNDIYWGLGVEHETYIETNKLKQISLKDLKEKRARERYCVDYYNVYNKESLNNALDGLFLDNKNILIPIIINSHTFQKTDINGEHATTFERIPKNNPNFNGTTIFNWMKEIDPYFEKEYEKSYIFDGDTVEFVTQDFYKATVKSVMNEIVSTEKKFIHSLNSLPKEGILKTYGPFQLAQQNYPFASYVTNLENNAMFNNGTYHLNITLPTKLNSEGKIEDFSKFTREHQNYARALQLISPLLIAKYGTYDPLSESKIGGDKYSAGSQRISVSRYIGLGTYDTDTMPTGKILTKPRSELKNIDWYDSFHKYADYTYLNDLGLDINFNKHFSHGIEFRIFESIPYIQLEELLYTIIYLADFSLEYPLENPTKIGLWHTIAENCVQNGKGYIMDVQEQNGLFAMFHIKYLSKEPMYVMDVLSIIIRYLQNKYKETGICSKCMIHGIPYSVSNTISNTINNTIYDIDIIENNNVKTEEPVVEPIINVVEPVTIKCSLLRRFMRK